MPFFQSKDLETSAIYLGPIEPNFGIVNKSYFEFTMSVSSLLLHVLIYCGNLNKLIHVAKEN